ncbi:SAM-dependent methyltransferase [Limibacillus halophilus]|uniref:Cyclopropane-fatty-acyl-phospholipid synthase n=1 Tax=Limibacillus halophilus TaxID=1579333 RepID=A0A839SRM4_9PROT|nr:cyclopropane-fatty-acyl-phospholipid synthase family protein [Limibacillus halophilus]MBB3064619.1 cyclopropane-fatty-acyl-phospholipid synthase [Limibacillus halophilus]
MLFKKLLHYTIREGALRLIDHNGQVEVIGDGTPPCCTLRLVRPQRMARLLKSPVLGITEGYMDGDWMIEDGDVRTFLDLAARNYHYLETHPLTKLADALLRRGRRLKQFNPKTRARKNVAHHYDLSSELYDLFLDSDRQYSCAYFLDPRDDIETAQTQKKRHIAAKLLLDRPGLKIMDIGSGWGGLGISLAKAADCTVKGVTLSIEQHKLSNERIRREGLESKIRFDLQDYREEQDRYDRIVSVGMFEHVGKANYREFFRKTHDLLADDGVFLLHTIGRLNEPGPINPFIRKYIFPGADVPTLSELTPIIEESGLLITDIEVLRLHYAETLKLWFEAFQANREKIKALYDERFCRMWEMYLVGCEMGFRHQHLVVYQIQLAKQIDTVPLTRDYMFEWERAADGEHKSQSKDQAAAE